MPFNENYVNGEIKHKEIHASVPPRCGHVIGDYLNPNLPIYKMTKEKYYEAIGSDAEGTYEIHLHGSHPVVLINGQKHRIELEG